MNKLKTLAAAAALLSGVSTSALAQEASYSPADANRDGITSDREWRDYNAPSLGQAQRMQAMPSDGMSGASDMSGKALSYDEADADRDGYVSRAEWDRYQGRVDHMMRERGRPHVEGEASYSAADANRDGTVSRDEWDKYHGRQPMR
jgi:CubicO group peptidase (beta-lactamase class C family)